MNVKKILEQSFLVIGFLTILEFIFIQGMFTWLIVVAAVIILGILNIVYHAKDREWQLATLYFLCTVALCMGYFKLL